VSWDGDRPTGIDLYYDPVVDEHVGRGPIGIVAPAWYFAPQKPDVARQGWQLAAMVSGALGGDELLGMDDPARATTLLQIAGEFADADTKARIWAMAERFIEPKWDRERGEFTLGFRLDEPHPRGQWNARSMAGWVCTEGAWGRVFNAPNLAKFGQPTVEGVDFPRVAMSEARWDGEVLHLAAAPQNASVTNSRTKVRVTNIGTTKDWQLESSSGERHPLKVVDGALDVELTVDNRIVRMRRA